MTANFHTPISSDKRPANAATFNAPLGELDAALTSEVQQRGAADIAEMQARIAADNAEAQARQTAITAEMQARAAGDAMLDNRIDQLIIDSGTSDAETIAARTAVPYAGTAPATLGDALALAAGGIANVLAFGADNTGATDCAAAVTAALAAHDAVYFPPGSYRIASTVNTGSGKRIWGNGATIHTYSADPTASVAPPAFSIDGSNVTIEGLTFRGVVQDHSSRLAGTQAWGGLIQIDAATSRQNIRIVNCTFTWAGRAVTFIDPSPVSNAVYVDDVLFSGCTFRDLIQNALHAAENVDPATNYTIRRLRFIGCEFVDIYAEDGGADGALYWSGLNLEAVVLSGCTFKNCITAFLRHNSGSGGVGMAYTNGLHISGCSFDGTPASGSTWYTDMGLDLAYVTDLVVTGCKFANIKIEAIAVFAGVNFAISGCTFRECGYGITLHEVNSVGSSGVISGCTFIDMHNAETDVAGYGIQLSGASAHDVRVSGCRFGGGAGAPWVGIRSTATSAQAIGVSNCQFVDLLIGINLSAGITYSNVTVQGCTFDGCTTYGINASGTLNNSAIATCAFVDCATDINTTTSTYVRCISNTHSGTTGTAIRLQNATWNEVIGCTFHNVATVHGGTAGVGPANPVVWQNNVYSGTTSAPTNSIGYATTNSQGQRIVFANSAPTSGTWLAGDLVYDVSPSAGSNVGWVCVTGGSPGTWKTWGTIAS